MSIFHLYTAYEIVPTQTLRPLHVAMVLVAVLSRLPGGRALPPPHHVVGLAGRAGLDRHRRLPDPRRRRLHRSQHAAEPDRHRLRRRADPARDGGDAADQRLDHAVHHGLLHRLRAVRPLPAAAVDAQGLRARPPGRPHVHDARRHLRRGRRRVLLADHPVHDLRRLPAVLRRRQVLHRLLLLGDGRQADRRRPHGRAVVVPARRPVGLGRGDHRDARLGRLSDARQGRATRRMPPGGCSPPAAWARSSRRRCSAQRPS